VSEEYLDEKLADPVDLNTGPIAQLLETPVTLPVAVVKVKSRSKISPPLSAESHVAELESLIIEPRHSHEKLAFWLIMGAIAASTSAAVTMMVEAWKIVS